MRNMNGSIINGSKENSSRHRPRFRVQDDRRFLWIVLEMRHPEGHIVEAQLAEGGVEVHLQSGGLGSKRWQEVGIAWTCANELGIVAARVLPGSLEREVEGRGVEDRRFCVRHGQDRGHTT